jgi:thymidylate synthase
MFLGIPFNIASYGLLLMMVAREVGMEPYMLVGDLTNVHIYDNHMAQVKEQLTREPHPLPFVSFTRLPDRIEDYKWGDVLLENYEYHPAIKGDIAV